MKSIKPERFVSGPGFDNGLTVQEYAMLVSFIPIHTMVLPNAAALLTGGALSPTRLTFICYALSAICTMVIGWRVLRRDYDTLFDHPLRILLEVLGSYFAMLAMNMAVALIFSLFTAETNPNNDSVIGLLDSEYGLTAAVSMFLAPIAEELMFRAGLFGVLSRFSRVGAYVGTILLFGLYHVWGFVINDPRYLLYLIQYVPVTFLLCRVYERTRSIWSCIFFHMLVNSVAVSALQELQRFL